MNKDYLFVLFCASCVFALCKDSFKLKVSICNYLYFYNSLEQAHIVIDEHFLYAQTFS